MRKRILFHIGPPKTGSSAIQNFLHSNRIKLASHGIYYPNHGVDENGVSSGNTRVICSPDPNGVLCLDRQKLTKLVDDFEQHPNFHTLLLSSESFFRIVDDIIKALPNIELLCFLRNPIEFQLSIYNQSIKRHGNQQPFESRRHLNMGQWEKILKIADELDTSHLHCFAYKLPSPQGSIIDDVLNVLGVSQWFAAGTASVNASYSFPALELKRWLNQFSIQAIQIELDAYLQSTSNDSQRYRLMSDETLHQYCTQLNKLEPRFHELLPEQDWNLVRQAHTEIGQLPLLSQEDGLECVHDLIMKLKREKPQLYRAISALLNKQSGEIENQDYLQLFKINGFEKVFGSFSLKCNSLLAKFKKRAAVSDKFLRAKYKSSVNHVEKLQDVELIPLSSSSSPAKVQGGVRGNFIPEYVQQFRYQKLNQKDSKSTSVSDLVYINEHAQAKFSQSNLYYGGPAFTNFGHFIAESIHRVAHFSTLIDTNKVKRIVFQPQKYRNSGLVKRPVLPPHFFEVLDYLGVKKTEIHIQMRPEKVKKLWVAPQLHLFRSALPITEEYKQFLLDCEQCAQIQPCEDFPKKLYVSRTPFLLRGAFAGETVLENCLSAHGYHILRPESLSLRAQLLHYKSAEVIVFAEGAALHVLELLGEISAEVKVIQRRQASHNLFSPLLSARAKRLAFFSHVDELPSLFFADHTNRPAHGSSLSVLNGEQLAKFLISELSIEGFDVKAFKDKSFEDINFYADSYKANITGNSERGLILEHYQQQVARLQKIGLLSNHNS